MLFKILIGWTGRLRDCQGREGRWDFLGGSTATGGGTGFANSGMGPLWVGVTKSPCFYNENAIVL